MPDFDNTPPESVLVEQGQWSSVRVAMTPWGSLPLLVANGGVVDGVTLVSGNRFACVGTRQDAGIYVVGALASTRATDSDNAGEFVSPRSVYVTGGTVDNVGRWVFTTPGPIVLGETNLTFSYLAAYSETIESSGFDNAPAAPVTLS